MIEREEKRESGLRDGARPGANSEATSVGESVRSREKKSENSSCLGRAWTSCGPWIPERESVEAHGGMGVRAPGSFGDRALGENPFFFLFLFLPSLELLVSF
ncbi:hypothetical protein CRG98_039564 [Punica granatum]|uniref:Uncharacterized protein n=1 Tax=Punica granatum TaxID=22663 RepID=A0A2I0I9K5_PUNGR|nr:hypothetical protein CRG98_039564 [Punica granatum]